MILIATVCGVGILLVLSVALWPRARLLLLEPSLRPDGPEPFGDGTAWLAIKTVDVDQVIGILGLGEVGTCNWQTGLAIVEDDDYSANYVFVTPPVEGWTFVVGLALPHPAGRAYTDQCLALQLALGKSFHEVQYFYACPVLDIVAWSRFSDAKLRRSFAWGDEGVIWNKGVITSRERDMRLKVFATADETLASPHNAIDEDESGYPEPAHVRDMAASWSLDPETLAGLPGDPALGYLGRMPETWRVRRLPSRTTIREPVQPALGTG